MSAAIIELSGEERFRLGPDALLAAVTDFALLPRVLPDVESCERVDPLTLRCVVRPGFSFLRGRLTVTVVRQAESSPGTARLCVESKGVGASVRVEITLAARADPDANEELSQLLWRAEVVELRGLVAAVSRPLIRAAACELIAKTWRRLHDELQRGAKPTL
jgi:carbon monoxide dehydrogenase subunit G